MQGHISYVKCGSYGFVSGNNRLNCGDTSGGRPISKPQPSIPKTNESSIVENLKEEGFPYVLSDPDGVNLPIADPEKITKWYYPTNEDLKERGYQKSMVKTGLMNNTLICLPTGLGKTFISSAIIYNFYAWFPESIIIFMAPSRPLVAQQIGATLNTVGIPKNAIVEMTGTMSPTRRAAKWNLHRIFFVTPHIVENDLKSEICPGNKISLIIMDEAHKARGKYPACEAIRLIASLTPHFRVVGLTATPGDNKKSIQTIIHNLLISKIEVRTDESIDVKQYIQNKTIERIRVDSNGHSRKARDIFLRILERPLSWLQNNGFMYRKNPSQLTKGQLFHARKEFRSKHSESPLSFAGEAYFGIILSLYHGKNLLDNYGLEDFKKYCTNFQMKAIEKKVSSQHKEVVSSVDWKELMDCIHSQQEESCHPKLEKLVEIVKEHFANHNDTRCIIFTEYRDSVDRIVSLLSTLSQVNVSQFVGQANQGLKQKDQVEIIDKFRKGTYNTLVATSIGEEGLDVGEVDLIVCYDMKASPIRMIQRMGRTGRKRKGRCVMLLTAEEEGSYQSYLKKSKTMMKSIVNHESLEFYDRNPRMLPGSEFPELQYINAFPQFGEDEIPQIPNNGSIDNEQKTTDVANSDIKKKSPSKRKKSGTKSAEPPINDVAPEVPIEQGNLSLETKPETSSVKANTFDEDSFNVYDEFFNHSQELKSALIPEAPTLFNDDYYTVNLERSQSNVDKKQSQTVDKIQSLTYKPVEYIDSVYTSTEVDELMDVVKNEFDFDDSIIENLDISPKNELNQNSPLDSITNCSPKNQLNRTSLEPVLDKVSSVMPANFISIEDDSDDGIDFDAIDLDKYEHAPIANIDAVESVKHIIEKVPTKTRKRRTIEEESSQHVSPHLNESFDLEASDLLEDIESPNKRLKRLTVDADHEDINIKELIDDEAEESGEDILSSDDEEEEEEEGNLSFVVSDGLEYTPPPQDVNMKSVYANSLLSNEFEVDGFGEANLAPKVKLKYMREGNLEDFEYDSEGYETDGDADESVEVFSTGESSEECKESKLDTYRKIRQLKLENKKQPIKFDKSDDLKLDKDEKQMTSPFKKIYGHFQMSTTTQSKPNLKLSSSISKLNQSPIKTITIDEDDDLFLSIDLDNIENKK